MRVLFVTPYVPSLIRIRPYNWIRGLCAAGHEISLFTLVSGAADRAALGDIMRFCAEITTEPMPRWRPLWNGVRALPGQDPLQLAWSRHPRLTRRIQAAVAARDFDIAHIEHMRGACFAPSLVPLPTVYDAVDSITFLQEQTRHLGPRPLDRWLAAFEVERSRRFEQEVIGRFDRVLVSASVDADYFRPSTASAGAERVVVLPNSVDLDRFHARSDGRDPATLIFSGKMSYHANIAAVHRLVSDILPVVWTRRQDVRLVIAGSSPPRSVTRLARDPRVTVTGYVADIGSWLRRATLAVCPTTYSAGSQNKVLEAMASGVPVVASRAATKALEAAPGTDYRLADDDETFAGEILDLLASPSAREALAAQGRIYVTAHHDATVLGQRLDAVYSSVRSAASPRRNPVP